MKLLIVEDDEGVSVAFQRVLTRLHANIVSVPSWGRMVECLKCDTFDVILLDLGLPDSSSTETLSKLKDLKMSYPNTAVCVITGNPLRNREEAMKAGADDFMQKLDAFKEPTLIQRVSELVSRFSKSSSMKKLDTQTALLKQAAQATIDEFNKDA